MSNKWTTVHPISWRDTSFTYIPYWIMDIIAIKFATGEDWREYSEEKYLDIFTTLKEAYDEYGDIDVIESRNGRLWKLSEFTVSSVTPTIGPSDFEPSSIQKDATIACADLFTFVPASAGQGATYISSDPDIALVSNGQITFVAAGTFTLTAVVGTSSGPVTYDLNLTVIE